MSNEAHITVQDVDVVYEGTQGSLRALDGINLSVGRGEFVSIIGPSGCGKSTLLRVIGGLQAPSNGVALIEGRPPKRAQHAKQIGFVFQDPSLLPWRTVLDNVRLPLQVNRAQQHPGLNPGLNPGATPYVDPQRMVDVVGLRDFAGYYPHQLSGGMQQRVAIARSFVTNAAVLLMDEPFGALDEITRTAMRYELMRVWRTEAAGRDCTVVFVTHSIAEAVLLSDRVIVMTPQPGRIAASLEINLPRPRAVEVEATPPFIEYMQTLRGLLREHALV